MHYSHVSNTFQVIFNFMTMNFEEAVEKGHRYLIIQT